MSMQQDSRYLTSQGVVVAAPRGYESARLPAMYEVARTALVKCDIDECLGWKDKGEALKAFFRIAKDRTFLNVGQRLINQAERRCGQLFIEIRGTGATKPTLDRTGISPSTRHRMVRIAQIDQEEFDRQNDQTPVPTARKLAGILSAPPSTPHRSEVFHGAINTINKIAAEKRPDARDFIPGGYGMLLSINEIIAARDYLSKIIKSYRRWPNG